MSVLCWRRACAGAYELGDPHRVSVERLNSGELGTWILFTRWGVYGFGTLSAARTSYEAAYDEFCRTGCWPPFEGATCERGREVRLADVELGVSVRSPAVYSEDGSIAFFVSNGPLVAVDETPVSLPGVLGLWLGLTCRARNGVMWKLWIDAQRPVVGVGRCVAGVVGSVDLTEPVRDARGNTVVDPVSCSG